MKTLETKILEKIKEKKIHPKSKNYFWFRNIFVWVSMIGMLIVSSFFSAGLFFIISNRLLVDISSLFALVSVVFLLIMGTLFVSYIQFKKIKNMYRKSMGYIFILLSIGIFIGGFLTTQYRLYSYVDDFSARIAPSLSLREQAYRNWSMPYEKNKLAIEVIIIDKNGYLYGEDFRGGIHMVDPILLDDEGQDIMFHNLRISMLGFEEDGIFYPEIVKPWVFKYKKSFTHLYYDEAVVNDNIKF